MMMTVLCAMCVGLCSRAENARSVRGVAQVGGEKYQGKILIKGELAQSSSVLFESAESSFETSETAQTRVQRLKADP